MLSYNEHISYVAQYKILKLSENILIMINVFKYKLRLNAEIFLFFSSILNNLSFKIIINFNHTLYIIFLLLTGKQKQRNIFF